MKLIFEYDTVIKKNTHQPAATIPSTHRLSVPAGTILTLLAWRESMAGHIVCTFDTELPTDDTPTEPKWNTWTVFRGHVQIAGVKTAPPTQKRPMLLQESDIARVAVAMGCDEAAVRAVIEIEASGRGFLPSGRPKILFEAHHFSRFTGRRYDSSYPTISSRTWNRRLYKGGEAEWDRLHLAAGIDRDSAWKSASWGLGQVMGFNYSRCGFGNVEAFVKAMERSEGDQLDAMFAFIKSNGLDRHLRSRDWTAFARGYNGAGFRTNNYHTKLAQAYARFKYRR